MYVTPKSIVKRDKTIAPIWEHSKIAALLRNYDRLTNQPTDRPTNLQARRELPLQIMIITNDSPICKSHSMIRTTKLENKERRRCIISQIQLLSARSYCELLFSIYAAINPIIFQFLKTDQIKASPSCSPSQYNTYVWKS